MAFIQAHQLDLMAFMSGICFILALTTPFIEFLSRRRKGILFMMELAAAALLIFDRQAYIFSGNESLLGFVMVRISNALVFFLSIFIPHLVTLYLRDLFKVEGRLDKTLIGLRICEALFAAGTVLILVSQFTGLLYTFDDHNVYHRSSWFMLSYIVPLAVVVFQEAILCKFRKRLSRGNFIMLTGGIALPTVAAGIQGFFYGISLTNVTMVLMIIVFFIYAISEMGAAVRDAAARELAYYREAERRESAMFRQTVEALANAIDAKDKYTRGHSARVAQLSRQIAEEAGFSEEYCDQVYFAGLLHDVGKIGVRREILNKAGKLTDEEYSEIKRHPALGNQILSSIKQFPALSIGAHYHHERYDGTGYPDGLSGEDIPEIVRIIAVADAYDAMNSKRSYRDPLSAQKTRNELVEGTGRQFDPRFADIMLQIIDRGAA